MRAWQALRRSRRLLPHPLQRTDVQLPLILGGKNNQGAKARPDPVYTGFSIVRASETLAKSGLGAAQINQALHAAVIKRFGSFANSWSNYITRHGWLFELLEMDEAERQPIIKRSGVGELSELVRKLAENPVAMLMDLVSLAQLATLSSRFEQEKGKPNNPICLMLTERHGLHPELALAVLKHSQSVPWWVLVVLPLAALVCGLVFVQAIINPHAQSFEDAGGVGILHYTAVPLLGAFFVAATVWLIKDRPRREKEWREQLDKYVRAVESRRRV